MADIDLKTETPDTSLPTTGFLFGADSQASASPSVYSTQTVATTLLGSTSLTGATITTSQPVLDLAQTWNAAGTTFTAVKMNVTDTASAAGSLLMDLQVGGTSRFKVAKSGQVNVAGTSRNLIFGGIYDGMVVGTSAIGYSIDGVIAGISGVAFSSGSLDTRDLFLTRRAAANLRLGAADVGATTATVTITIAAPGVVTWTSHGFSTGTPVVFTTTGALPTGITAGTTYYAVVVDANTFQIASSVANAIATPATVITTSGTQSGTHTGTRYNITQRLGMQSVTGVTDRLGADLIIQGSQGTGTGAGGSIVFQVAPAGSSGTAQNALATALEIKSTGELVGVVDANFFSFNRVNINNNLLGAGVSGIANFVLFNGANTSTGIAIRAEMPLSWSSAGAGSTYTQINTVDVSLYRDAANTLALRRGTNAQTFRVYNTWTSFGSGTEIWERGKFAWESNVLTIGTEKGANGGTARALEFQTDGTTRLAFNAADGGFLSSTTTNASSNALSGHWNFRNTNASQSIGSGAVIRLAYDPAAAISATSRMGAVFFSGTRNSAGNIIDAATIETVPTQGWVNGSKYGAKIVFNTITSDATSLSAKMEIGDAIAISDAINVSFATTTGTKIGTATSQKLGFWNATPIVQPTTAVAAATVAATGIGDVVAASTTFDGYTIPQIVKALRNAGLLA